MSNSLQMGKKALSIVVVAATVLWTVGLTSFVAPSASAASYGDLIKGTTLSTVYYYGSDGQRYAFPNEKTFFSWFPDFSGVVTISDSELANITLAGNIVVRPGSRWIKITSDAKVYAVARDGSIRWVENEATAVGLAGAAWNTFIDDVPDVFFVDYTVGDSLTSAASGYEGMVWSDGTMKYIVWGGKVHTLSASGMTANWIKAGSVLMGSGFNKSSLPMAAAEITAKLAFLTDAAQMVETADYAQTQQISVALASSSPAASTLVTSATNVGGATPGQAIGKLASYTFTNPTSSAVKVTNVKMRRKGVSSDATLVNVYLFNGWVRLADSATVSSGLITWNDASGLFTIPAGGSMTVDVRADLLTGTSGQTVGVSLDPDDVSFSGAFDSTGTEMASAVHTIATVGNFGTVSFAAPTPAANANANVENDYRIWESSVSVNNNEAWLHTLRFRNIGSINAADLGNWRLYVAGTMRGVAVPKQDANGYITFDLSANPVKLNTGVHTFKVLVDVIGGSTRTVTVGMRNSADAVFVEDDYNQPILVQRAGGTFSALDAGAQTLASGNISFTKKTNSASGDVINLASGASLASFEVKATGEPVKIESLDFNIVQDDAGDNAYTLRNGAVYVNGVQVGSTTAIPATIDITAPGAVPNVYARFTFGSSFVVNPGTPVIMEVKADVYDSDGANDVVANDTIQVQIESANVNSNMLLMSSGSYISRPGADIVGNTLTVRTGGLTTANNASYSAQSVVAPKTDFKVGSWTIKAATTESVNLTQFDVGFSAVVDAALASDDYTNLYLKYGPAGNENTSSIKTTVSDTSNVWSLNYTLAPGETIYVNAYANVASSVSDGDATVDTVTADLTADGTSVASGTAIPGAAVLASVISWFAGGTFSTSLDGSTPVAKATGAGQTIEAAKYRYNSLRESYSIDQIQVKVGSNAAATAINRVELYDGATLLGSSVFNIDIGGITNGGALVTGLNISVPAGSYKVITAKLVLNSLGIGMGASQQNLALTLDNTRYSDSQGAVLPEGTDRAGNEIRAYNSIPSFTAVDLTNSTLVNGQARDLYKFTVTAGSNGPISLKQLKFPIAWTDGTVDNALEMESWKLYKNGTDISTNNAAIGIRDNAGEDIEDTTGALEANTSVIVVWSSSEDVIVAGETVTYTLRATPVLFDSGSETGDQDFFTMYLAGDSAGHNALDVCLEDTGATIWNLDNRDPGGVCTADPIASSAYNIIWSDNSGDNHLPADETGSGDWANGYLLLNLDLSGETWVK